MTTIIEALQNKDNHLRVSAGDRWLVADDEGGWIVYGRKPYAKQTVAVAVTDNEAEAVEALLKDW